MGEAAGRRELLIATIAGLLEGCRHVAVGAASPIPAAGALLARERSGGRLLVSLLGSESQNPFTNGGVELFDAAAEGRIDAFFLGGVQIDGAGNVNLLGLGRYPALKKRFSGNFGSAYLAFLVPRLILFREEHTTENPGRARRLCERARHLRSRHPPPRRPEGAAHRPLSFFIRRRPFLSVEPPFGPERRGDQGRHGFCLRLPGRGARDTRA